MYENFKFDRFLKNSNLNCIDSFDNLKVFSFKVFLVFLKKHSKESHAEIEEVIRILLEFSLVKLLELLEIVLLFSEILDLRQKNKCLLKVGRNFSKLYNKLMNKLYEL